MAESVGTTIPEILKSKEFSTDPPANGWAWAYILAGVLVGFLFLFIALFWVAPGRPAKSEPTTKPV